MVPFVGLRRPFSPQAERLVRGSPPYMKKSKATAEAPIGIVIATGQTSPLSPRVRAYFWCDVETSEVSRSEDESHFGK